MDPQHNPLPSEIQPCGDWALSSYRWLDDQVSDALGIQLVSEDSRGDEFETWGAATYYFEVGEDGWPIRQLEVYDAGPVLRYGPGREEDECGQLGQARLDELEDWAPWTISQNEFEKVWKAGQERAERG